jgi:hypothetical protein
MENFCLNFLAFALSVRKAHEKSLTSIAQSLMAGPNCRAGQGKDGAAVNLGQLWLLQKGEGKEVSACAVVSGRGGALLELRIFCLRAAVLGSFSSEV